MKINLFLSAFAVCSSLLFSGETTSIPIKFPVNKNSTIIHGSIKGYESIDYQIQALAGQKLSVTMKSSSLLNGFNVYAPVSDGTAMFFDGGNGNKYSGIVPNDGVYVVRVYLVRAAARRNETAKFDLVIQVDGKALKPLLSSEDALVKGTHYHATGSISCKPPYKPSTQCDAMVIRRSFDGTATVIIKKDTMTRQILFYKGKPIASDSFVPMSLRKESVQGIITILFDKDESYDIPEALVFGG